MNQRRTALITGWSIVVMAIAAGFVFGFALPEFSTSQEGETLYAQIENQSGLYVAMLVGLIFIQLLDALVSFTFFKFFEHENRKIAAISGGLRFIYTLIFSFGTLFLIRNLSSEAIADEVIISNLQSFQYIWNAGLIIFGMHIVLLGFLMKQHGRIHYILWDLTLIAGGAYCLVSGLKLVEFNPELTKNLEMVLALPMTVGELGLAIWMIVKGGKKRGSTHLKEVTSEPLTISAAYDSKR